MIDSKVIHDKGAEKVEETSAVMMPLTMVEAQTTVVIQFIKGGCQATRRLQEMGLIPGETIKVIRSFHSGPVMLKVKGSRLALGFGLAMKVMVSI